MILKHLKVSNFRSIGEIDIELSPLTVLVGPNASGKSNILDALQFVKDVFRDGLESAVDARQGAGYVRCQADSVGGDDVVRFDLTFEPNPPLVRMVGRSSAGCGTYSLLPSRRSETALQRSSRRPSFSACPWTRGTTRARRQRSAGRRSRCGCTGTTRKIPQRARK